MAPAPGGHAIRDEQHSPCAEAALVATAAQPWAFTAFHQVALHRLYPSGGFIGRHAIRRTASTWLRTSARCRRGGGARVAAAAGSESAISMCNENDQSHVCEQSTAVRHGVGIPMQQLDKNSYTCLIGLRAYTQRPFIYSSINAQSSTYIFRSL